MHTPKLSDEQVKYNLARKALAECEGIDGIELSDAAFDGMLTLLGETSGEDWTVYRTQVGPDALDELMQHRLIKREEGRWGWNVNRPMYTVRYTITMRGKDYLWWWGVRR